MEAWINGMLSEDIELMMSAYHDDAVSIFHGPDGDWTGWTISRVMDSPIADWGERVYAVDTGTGVTAHNSFTYKSTEDGRILIARQDLVIVADE